MGASKNTNIAVAYSQHSYGIACLKYTSKTYSGILMQAYVVGIMFHLALLPDLHGAASKKQAAKASWPGSDRKGCDVSTYATGSFTVDCRPKSCNSFFALDAFRVIAAN